MQASMHMVFEGASKLLLLHQRCMQQHLQASVMPAISTVCLQDTLTYPLQRHHRMLPHTAI
jgi:hypothetical protein